MSLAIPIVRSELQRLHQPDGEIWVGVRTPGTEAPERIDRILATLDAAGAELIDARSQADDALLAIHEPAMVEYLEGAWREWDEAGLTSDPGQDRVVPYIVPHPGLFNADVRAAVPVAESARAGYFAYDTMTLIGPGTWEAARAAVDTALTAADIALAGARVAYACCRPPGHHATRTCFGGSCYLNNAAAAAARLREALDDTVAVIDIDAHHGNGTQQIFYEDATVLTGSVHVDPGAGWFPHFLGFGDEPGAGVGVGANRNLCLAPGAGDAEWLAAISELATWAVDGGAAGIVVALGVDAAGGDPEAPLDVSVDGFREAGRILSAIGRPTAIVQEGGYDLETIGGLVLATLEGFEE